MRDELVAFGSPGELIVDENGVVGAGKHLNPYEVHKLVEERGDEVVFLMRVTLLKQKSENSKMR